MAVRFTTSFKNALNKLYVIEIRDINYSGAANTYIAPVPGFTLNYQQSGDSALMSPVIASSVSVPMYIDTIRTQWNTFIQNVLKYKDESDVQVYITEDAEPFWIGILQVERLQLPDGYYSEVSLTATDGFGILKSIPYDNAGSLYTGYNTVIEHITQIISKLKTFHVDFLHPFIHTMTWINSDVSNDLLSLHRISYDAFKEQKDDETVLPYDCYTVLLQILQRFNLRLIQQGASYYIQEYTYFANTNNVIRHWDDNAGEISSETIVPNITTIEKLSGGSTYFREAAKNVTIQYAYKDAIQGGNLIVGLIAKNATYNLGEIPGGNEEVLAFGFKFYILYQPTSNNGTILVKFAFKVQQGAYYLKNTGGVYAWTPDSSNRIYLYSEPIIYESDYQQYLNNINFITAAIPNTDNVTIQWTYAIVDIFDNPKTIDGTLGVANTENQAILLYGLGEAGEGTNVTIATKLNKSGELIELEPFVIGDGPFSKSIGRIQGFNGSSWVDTTAWNHGGITGKLTLDEYVARAIMSIQTRPVECINLVFRSNFNPAYEILNYLMITASYEANAAIWNVEAFKLLFFPNDITYTYYTHTDQTGSLPNGVGQTPPPATPGYWQRTGTDLTPIEDGDNVRTTGEMSGGSATFGSDGNYFVVNSSGHLELIGTASVFDIVSVPGLCMRPPASAGPGLEAFATSLRVYAFDKTTIESLYFSAQLPRDYKDGSSIYPIIAFIPMQSDSTQKRVTWGLDYLWQNKGGAGSGVASVLTSSAAIPNEIFVGYKYYITALDAISGTGKEAESILTCRVYRDAADKLDDFDNDAGLLAVYFIYEKNKLGSDTK